MPARYRAGPDGACRTQMLILSHQDDIGGGLVEIEDLYSEHSICRKLPTRLEHEAAREFRRKFAAPHGRGIPIMDFTTIKSTNGHI